MRCHLGVSGDAAGFRGEAPRVNRGSGITGVVRFVYLQDGRLGSSDMTLLLFSCRLEIFTEAAIFISHNISRIRQILFLVLQSEISATMKNKERKNTAGNNTEVARTTYLFACLI